MKQCGITISTDESENHLIECFKPGNPCHDGLKMLNSDGAALENFSARMYDHDLSGEDDEIDSDGCDSDYRIFRCISRDFFQSKWRMRLIQRSD